MSTWRKLDANGTVKFWLDARWRRVSWALCHRFGRRALRRHHTGCGVGVDAVFSLMPPSTAGGARHAPQKLPSAVDKLELSMEDCPSAQCSGGTGRAYEVKDPDSVRLPEELWASRGNKRLLRCSYCGFLWFTYTFTEAPRPFLIKEAVGFYGHFTQPGEFHATPNHPMRDAERSKPRRRHLKGGRRGRDNRRR